MRSIGVGYIEGALVEIIKDAVVVKSGYTDANGKYSTILGAGTYKIRISKTGFQTIEKTEILAYPSELMVNLPYMVPIEQRSGAAFLYVTGMVGNPAITTIFSVRADPTIKIGVQTTVYAVSVA